MGRAWRSRFAAGWGLGLSWTALACGATGEPGTLGGTGGTAGGTGSGIGGTGGERPLASAPACTTDVVPFIWVRVGSLPEGPNRVRVIASGFGLPPGVTELPNGATSAEQLGWMQVALLGDAAITRDAGTDDAGPYDAGRYDDLPRRVILGPREVAELPVVIGEALYLTREFEYISALLKGHSRVVLEQQDRVLLFHQHSELHMFGTFSGFTLALGDAVCARPYPTAENPCSDIYRHQLEVTVPGGVTAALMPGQAQTLGQYRVLHGTTSTVTRFSRTSPRDTGCADVDDGPTEITALLRAGEP